MPPCVQHAPLPAESSSSHRDGDQSPFAQLFVAIQRGKSVIPRFSCTNCLIASSFSISMKGSIRMPSWRK